jgi:hypothetical protein
MKELAEGMVGASVKIRDLASFVNESKLLNSSDEIFGRLRDRYARGQLLLDKALGHMKQCKTRGSISEVMSFEEAASNLNEFLGLNLTAEGFEVFRGALEKTKAVQEEVNGFLDAENANITDEKIETWLLRLNDCEFRSSLFDKLMGWKSVMNELKNIKKLKREKISIKICIANLRRVLSDGYRNDEIESLLVFFETRKTWYESYEKILNRKRELSLEDVITSNGVENDILTSEFLDSLIEEALPMLILDTEIFSLQSIRETHSQILLTDELPLESLIEKVRSQFSLGIVDALWQKRCQVLRSRLNFKINAESIFRLFGEDTSKFKELDHHTITHPVI